MMPNRVELHIGDQGAMVAGAPRQFGLAAAQR